MSDNQQEQPLSASSGTQGTISSHSTKKNEEKRGKKDKEQKYPAQTLDLLLGRYIYSLTEKDHQAWSSFFETLLHDPRWISQTGYNLHSGPQPFDHQRQHYVVSLDGEGTFSQKEAEEKFTAAVDILKTLGFKGAYTLPGTYHISMIWGHPSLENILENFPTLYWTVPWCLMYVPSYQIQERVFLYPDEEWLEHIHWEKDAEEGEEKVEGDTVDAEREETMGRDL
ncbi:hypothetical protein QBC32DRAFT_315569 [Pseudoneurospora amorphoporcata]|uniref:Uncharacterized protein n=1 Tax=Pseudoneurospora amorphoporcata TaxID=241081 RepID=A0AAN6SF69_9PEZI|nr:hypothetical protein QBC32DRAFT_315569 [Pseudoneurospora amorphoporcata]